MRSNTANSPDRSRTTSNGFPSTLLADIRCVHCGYGLQGLFVDGACAECGRPVRRSLELDSLKNADRSYLRSLHRGVTLFCIGGTLTAGLPLVTLGAGLLRFFRFFPLIPSLITPTVVLGFVGVLFLCTGYFLLSRQDPARHEPLSLLDSRVLSRALVALIGIVHLTGFLVQISPTTVGTGVSPLAMTIIIASLNAAFLSASSAYAQRLLVRVPGDQTAPQAGRFVWLLPLICLAGICFPMVWVGQLLQVRLLWPLRKDLAQMLRE